MNVLLYFLVVIIHSILWVYEQYYGVPKQYCEKITLYFGLWYHLASLTYAALVYDVVIFTALIRQTHL